MRARARGSVRAEPGGSEAYVALGSNLGDRERQLKFALRVLAGLAGTRLVAVSALYETQPMGGPPQAPYLNAVVKLRTRLGPRALLERLHAIEAQAGRVRGAERNAPRTLDLDLLLYGEHRIEEPGLTLPHPRLAERAFVLEPLCDLAPELIHPTLGERVETLARRVRDPARVRPWSGASRQIGPDGCGPRTGGFPRKE